MPASTFQSSSAGPRTSSTLNLTELPSNLTKSTSAGLIEELNQGVVDAKLLEVARIASNLYCFTAD